MVYRQEQQQEAVAEGATSKPETGSPHEQALAERDEARRKFVAGEIDRMPTGLEETPAEVEIPDDLLQFIDAQALPGVEE